MHATTSHARFPVPPAHGAGPLPPPRTRHRARAWVLRSLARAPTAGRRADSGLAGMPRSGFARRAARGPARPYLARGQRAHTRGLHEACALDRGPRVRKVEACDGRGLLPADPSATRASRAPFSRARRRARRWQGRGGPTRASAWRGGPAARRAGQRAPGVRGFGRRTVAIGRRTVVAVNA